MRVTNLLNISYLRNRVWPTRLLIDKNGQTFNSKTRLPVGCPRFRNDDVSWDTPLDRFEDFCRLFWSFSLKQLHGITLNGSTRTLFLRNGVPVQYDGIEDIAKVPNSKIKELAREEHFEDRADIIRFLENSNDDIALHGLFHTDYSVMEPDDQRKEICEGIRTLQALFPHKKIRYFIAPFNRVGKCTEDICREFGLEVLADIGVHLEGMLPRVHFSPETWYRYHHHRFYPESTFTYYKLSLRILKRALSMNFKLVDKRINNIEPGSD